LRCSDSDLLIDDGEFVAGCSDTFGTEPVQASCWAASFYRINILDLLGQPAGALKASQDRIELAAGEARLAHEVVSIPRLPHIVEELSKHRCDSEGHSHLTHSRSLT